jgi:tetrapyrrole methylase family protein/MazG family protein
MDTEFQVRERYALGDLIALVRKLRGEGGCPWDRVQTHASLRRNLLEEAYEAAGAIDEEDPVHLREELGDVLLQVIFHAGIEQDAGRFDLDDVADAECKKLVFRHPHVFAGGAERMTAEQVPDAWDKVKQAERGQKTVSETMESVAESLPGLWRAEKLLSKAAKGGLLPDTPEDAAQRLAQQAGALSRAVQAKAEPEALEAALGRLLLSAAETARLLSADGEAALGRACAELIDRARLAERDGGTMSLTEPDGSC